MTAPWDFAIVGGGLAGTTLAWQLVDAGQRVLLIDDRRPLTASRVAAGLITPITGPRLALSWRVSEFLPVARDFYRRIEARTGASFFHERTAIRLLASDTERALCSTRRLDPAMSHLISDAAPMIDTTAIDASGGAFSMPSSQLDVARYLDVSRTFFTNLSTTIDWNHDVTFNGHELAIAGQRAQRVITCEGYAAARNPWFDTVPFASARGDILTVRLAMPLPPKALHRGVWLAPTDDPTVFYAGATFDRSNLVDRPSAAGRADIEARLKAFLRVPYDVIDHRAAVRPIIRQSKPVIGIHAREPRLGFFNGLGSKGALTAPWCAAAFARHLVDGVALPDDLDLAKVVR